MCFSCTGQHSAPLELRSCAGVALLQRPQSLWPEWPPRARDACAGPGSWVFVLRQRTLTSTDLRLVSCPQRLPCIRDPDALLQLLDPALLSRLQGASPGAAAVRSPRSAQLETDSCLSCPGYKPARHTAETQLRAVDTLTHKFFKCLSSLEAARQAGVHDRVLQLLLSPVPAAGATPRASESDSAGGGAGEEQARSLGALLGALLAHHCSVGQLRHLLLLLRSEAPGGAPYAHLALLEALEWAAVPPPPGPRSRFSFGGPIARIDLGCVDPFPEDSLTLWMWIRLEPGTGGNGSLVPASMGLLSMTNDTATGLDISLEASGRHVVLRTYSRGAVDSGAAAVTLVPGRWHSLCIVMERRTLLSDRACVYCDGLPAPVVVLPTTVISDASSGPTQSTAAAAQPQLTTSAVGDASTPHVAVDSNDNTDAGGSAGGPTVLALKYPSAKGLVGGMTHCSIGGASPGRSSLQGQLACFAAFAVAANAKEVEQLHAATRGPHAALEPALLGVLGGAAATFGGGTLTPLLQGGSVPPPGSVPPQQQLPPPRLLSGRRGGLVLCLDPRTADVVASSTQSSSADAVVKVYHVGGADGALRPAELGPCTSCVVTTTFGEALAALGGPTWLLPLLVTPSLAQAAAASRTHVHAGLNRSTLTPAQAAELPVPAGGAGIGVLEFATCVSVLAASLEEEANREAWASSNGTHTLAELLHGCPVGHLSSPLLAACRRLVAALAPRHDAHVQAAVKLLFDIPLWAREGGAVAMAHLHALAAEWLPRQGNGGSAQSSGPVLTARHVIRGLAATPRSTAVTVTGSGATAGVSYRDSILGLLQQLLACDSGTTQDILAALTWHEHGGGSSHASQGAVHIEGLSHEEHYALLEDALDALLAVAERQLGAPAGGAPPGPCAAALTVGGCGVSTALALLAGDSTPSTLRAGALRLAQLSLVATATASSVAVDGSAGLSGSDASGAGGQAGGSSSGGGDSGSVSQSAASSASANANAGGSSSSTPPVWLPSTGAEPLCAVARGDTASGLCSALVDGCAAGAEGGVTLPLWDALCPLLLEGVAGAPVRPFPATGDPPSRRQSSNTAHLMALGGGTMGVSAASAGSSPRGSLDLNHEEVSRVSQMLLNARIGTAAAITSSNMVGADAFAGGYVAPRGGGCRALPLAAPPPRRLPGGHTAKLAGPASGALVPALFALRNATNAEVRLAAARDYAAVLLTATPAAAVASRAVLYSQSGWAEALLSLALWPLPQHRRTSVVSFSLQAPAPAVAAALQSPPTSDDASSASVEDKSGEQHASAGGDTPSQAPVEDTTPSSLPAAASVASRPLPLPQGPLGAAAVALWRDKVTPTPVLPSNAPFTEDVACACLRASGPHPLLCALRAPFATPTRRAALITALSGAFANDPDVLIAVAHDILVECVAATTASAMCRDAGLPAPGAAGSWAHPLEKLRASVEAACECARACRTARRDVARLVLLRTAAHARALLDGGWVSAAVAADGDEMAADQSSDYAPPMPPSGDDANAAMSTPAALPPRSATSSTSLSPAQELNVRANLLVLGSLCLDELDTVEGIVCPPPVHPDVDLPPSIALENSLVAATRWVWRASAPPLPRAAGGAACPPWLEDDRHTQCGGAGCTQQCVAGRRHHCRLCGGLFCAECSPNKALLPEMALLQQRGSAPHRVCNPCMDASAPLQGVLSKGGALMPGALRAAPAYAALRSLVAEVEDRCACAPGAPPPGPAVSAVAMWLVRAGMVRPEAAAGAPAVPDADASVVGGGQDVQVAPAQVITPAAVVTAPSGDAGMAAHQASSGADDAAPSAPPASVPTAAAPFMVESEPGDARAARQQLLRWTLLRLFAVLSSTLAARDAAALPGGDAAQAARLNNSALHLCGLTARVARATDPLDEGVDDDDAYVVLLGGGAEGSGTATGPDGVSSGAPSDAASSTAPSTSASSAPGPLISKTDTSGVPLRAAFQRAFAALGRGDADCISSAAALASCDAGRLLGIPAFGPVRSNAWAAAARVARVVRFGRSRRLVLEACMQFDFLDAQRSRAASDARLASNTAVRALCRLAAGASYDEAATLMGGNCPQPQLSAWHVAGPFAPQRTPLAAAAGVCAAARALRRIAFSAGPWALSRSEMREGRAFWRLDSCEDSQRVRRRLKRYAHGSTHAGAAHASTAALMAAALAAGELDSLGGGTPTGADGSIGDAQFDDGGDGPSSQTTLYDDPTSPAPFAGTLRHPPGSAHRRQHSLHLVRAVSYTSAPVRRLSQPGIGDFDEDPFVDGDELDDELDNENDDGGAVRQDADVGIMSPVEEEEDANGMLSTDGDDGDDECEEDEEGEDDAEMTQQQLSFLSPRASGGSGMRTPMGRLQDTTPSTSSAPSTGGESSSRRTTPLQTTPLGAADQSGDSEAPVVISIGDISLTPMPYPTPAPKLRVSSRQPSGGSGGNTLNAVDELAVQFVGPEENLGDFDDEDAQAGPAIGSGSEDLSDANAGVGSTRVATGSRSLPPSSASSSAAGQSHGKSRRGLLRRFRAGAKSLGTGVADATARVRLATGEAITAIRDDVTAAADAAARVASNTLAMGGLQGLMRSGSMKVSSQGAGTSGQGTAAGMPGGAVATQGSGSAAGGAAQGVGGGVVLLPSFVAPAELIRPTRVVPGMVYVTKAAVEWIPMPPTTHCAHAAIHEETAPPPPPPAAAAPVPDASQQHPPEMDEHHTDAQPSTEADAAPGPSQPAPIEAGALTVTIAPPSESTLSAPFNGVAAPERARRWPLSDIVAIYPRRFLLRRRALELFLSSGKSVLLHLPEDAASKAAGGNETQSASEALHRAILGERPPRLVTSPLFAQPLSARSLLRRSRWTARWLAGKMSNFEYLMLLNTAAGRTFHDLQQYPVFPWVLADYESQELDLDNPASYRDLTKPIGALNPTRLAAYLDRYQAMATGDLGGAHGGVDEGVPPFHYGTHYSSLGSVLFFLLRLAPFTEAALALQEGRLDVADRLFADIGESWRNVNTASADVKELIPELFTCPELLRNGANLPLGSRQDGTPVDDVTLPPWAHGSPERFVRLHRAALESEYVSQRLHHWIDLIFGYKQRGPAAETAHNLFYFLTYEDGVNVDEIDDPVERAAVEAQIALFGQCPSQLFATPHPQRQPGASRRAVGSNDAHSGPVLRTWGAAIAHSVRPGARPGPVLRLLPPSVSDGASGGGVVAVPPPPVALFFHPGDRTAATLVDADGCIRPLRFGGVVPAASIGGADDGAGSNVDGNAGVDSAGDSGQVDGQGAPVAVDALTIAVEERVKRSLLPSVTGGPLGGPTSGAAGSLLPWAGPRGCSTTVAPASAPAMVPAYMRAALIPGTGGGVLIAGHWAGFVWLLHPDDPACGPIQAIQHPGVGASVCVAASEDGNVAATGGADGSLALWKVGVASQIASAQQALTLDGHRGALAGFDARVGSIGGGSRRLGRRDKSQWLLDVLTKDGHPHVRCFGHSSSVTAVAVSASLGVCLSGGADGTCLLHAVRDGRCIRALRVPPSAHDVDTADALAASPGKLLSRQSQPSGEGVVAREEDLCGAVTAVAIGPEGELVIHAAPAPSSGAGGRHLLCVYSLNGRPMAAMQLRTPLTALNISFCGRWLITASESEVTVLALHTLEPVAETAPPRDAGHVTCAALSPCGRALLFATADGGLCGSIMDAVLGD